MLGRFQHHSLPFDERQQIRQGLIHDEFCTGTVEIEINFDVEVSKKVKNFETTIQCTDDAGDDNVSSEKIKVSKKNGKGVTNECELEDGDSVIGELAPIAVL